MDLSPRKMFRLGGRPAPQRRPPREKKKDDDAERLRQIDRIQATKVGFHN